MRFRSPIVPIVTLLLTITAMPAPARGDDLGFGAQGAEGDPKPQMFKPDMEDLMGALDEASSSVDIAWLQTLVNNGQYDAAISGQKSALSSAGRLSGEKNIAAISRIHAWVARAFLAKGELELAADSYRRALETMKSSESTRRELEVDAQVGLGWISLCKGDIDTSLDYFNNAHLTLEKQGRANSAGRVPLLLGTARAHLARGDRTKAQGAVDQAQSLGGPAMEANTLRVQLLIDLANADAERAGKTIRRLHEVENGENTLREIANTSFERHNLTMVDKLMTDLDLTLTVTAMTNGNDSETRRVALTSLLRRKGLVLEVVAARNATVRKVVTKNPQLAERVEQLAEIEAELAALERLPPNPTEREAHARRVAELIASADFRRMAIALYLPRGGGALEVVQKSNAITIEAVQAALPPDGALVEIVRYRPAQGKATNELSRWGEAHYAAFVLKHTGESIFLDLGDAASIENLVADFRRSLSKQEADVEKHGRKLDARIMAPLRPHLEGVQRLWISPDRALHTVPFEAFVDESNHYLVERFGITYVGTGRELTKPKSTNGNTNKPFILANPTFARSAPAGNGSAEKTRSVDFRKVHFDPLPGTAAEAEGIHKALPDATVVTGEAATREALLTLARPSILHIATHGFYLAQEKPKQESGTVRGLELDAANEASEEGEEVSADPLLRSGLALAGADGGAGIVSALELASMDLIGTKLAVLSACETGLGDLKNGEGVFGLRRALVIAGAEAQVVSLWQVDDEATRTMMVDYYTRLEAGGGRSEAMRATRLTMMRNPQTAHPFYWASFLVSGDSTALDGSDVPSTPIVLEKPPAVSAGARGCHCNVVADSPQTNEMTWVLVALLSQFVLMRGRFLGKKTAKSPPRKTIA